MSTSFDAPSDSAMRMPVCICVYLCVCVCVCVYTAFLYTFPTIPSRLYEILLSEK